MSYDISLCDPVTHEPLKADSTHFIAGGIAMAARTTMELNAVLAVLAMPLTLWKMPRQP